MGWSLGVLSFSLCSISFSVLPLNRNKSGLKIFKMGGWPLHSTGDHAYLLEMVSTGSISPLLLISARVIPVEAKVIPIVSWEPFASLASGTLQWLPPVPHPSLVHNFT